LKRPTGLGTLAIALTGAELVMHGSLDRSLLPLLVVTSSATFVPISEIAQVSRQLADTVASVRRLRVVQDEVSTVADGPREPRSPVGGSSLHLDRVTFAYPGRQVPALSDVTLEAHPGSTVALVGPSGAGKTTVTSLLMRFWDPAGGRILLDGVDLRELTLDGLRRRVAIVAQNTYMFKVGQRFDRPRPHFDAGSRRREFGEPGCRGIRSADRDHHVPRHFHVDAAWGGAVRRISRRTPIWCVRHFWLVI
jgi:ABC-type multidrug transport system fused ATPase/permease subunit